TRCASITGAWLAAALAVQGLMSEGKLAANPLRDHVAAISVGLVGGQTVLDLDYPEDSGCDADMNIVMTGQGGFVEVQGTAEGQTFDRATLDELLDLAGQGIADLVELQKQPLSRTAGTVLSLPFCSDRSVKLGRLA